MLFDFLLGFCFAFFAFIFFHISDLFFCSCLSVLVYILFRRIVVSIIIHFDRR